MREEKAAHLNTSPVNRKVDLGASGRERGGKAKEEEEEEEEVVVVVVVVVI